MCGIGGYIGSGSESYRRDLLAKFTDALMHRGPDGNGSFCDDGVALAHTRLSILDLSENASQPMQSNCERYALTYNGELYNFKELQRELIARGRMFVSLSSDTEVVLQSLMEWGVSALERFNGMFALALWDAKDRSLLLARDRFGIKPLYYVPTDNGLAFSSEVNALLSTGLLQPTIDVVGMHEYLFFGNSLGENTLFKDCSKLPAGSYLTISADSTICIKTFWTIDQVQPVLTSESEAVEKIQHLLRNSVERHLISDVPVGLFLSGGLDSSTLCALASQHGSSPINTYSVDFEGMTAHSELLLAKEVSDKFNTNHNEVSIGWQNLMDTLDAITEAHGQPFGDAGNLPLYLLTQQLPADMKVVLQGDGGDELFGGYRRYRLLRYTHYFKWLSRLPFTSPGEGLDNPVLKRIQRMISALGEPCDSVRCASLLTEEPDVASVNDLFTQETRQLLLREFPIGRYEAVIEGLPSHVRENAQQTMLHTDMQILLADYFLEKVDRSTMANSVEIRVPFLDTELCDYVMGLPPGMKLKGNSKHLLRKAMQGSLPKSVIQGRKYGFGVPYVEWLRGPLSPLVEERLLGSNSLINDLFDQPKLTKLWLDFKAKRNNRGFMIYKLLMLSLWIDRYSVTQ